MKTFLMAVFGLVLSAPSWGAMPSAATVEYVGNRMPGGAGILLGTQLTKLKVQVAKGTFDVAKQGGSTISNINLRGVDGKAVVIPAKAIIKKTLIDVITLPNTGDPMPTLSFNAATTGDLGLGYTVDNYTQGPFNGIQTGDASFMLKLSAPATLSAKVGTSTLTAGKFNVFVEYYLSD